MLPIARRGNPVNRHLSRQRDQYVDRLLRHIRKADRFRTLNGRVNFIVGRDRAGIEVQSSRPRAGTARTYRLEFSELRRGVGEIVEEGMADRDSLMQKNVRYTSAVQGLLVNMLPKVFRKIRLVTGRLLIRLTSVRVYVGGTEHNPDAIDAADKAGGAFLMMSYYRLKDWLTGRGGAPPAWLRHAQANQQEVLFEPGEFTEWQRRKKGLPVENPITQDRYLAFLRQFKPKRAIALDKVGDARQSRRNFFDSVRQGFTNIIPIFHYGQPFSVLKRLIKLTAKRGWAGLVALGGHVDLPEKVRGDWFAECFEIANGHPLHGLGVGGFLVAMFPWFSVDNTTYLCARARGVAKVLTDVGRLDATCGKAKALAANVGYTIRMGTRRLKRDFQMRFDEALTVA